MFITAHSEEARRCSLASYKAWCKSIPWIVKRIEAPVSQHMYEKKLRQEFEARDLRARDLLIIKGKNELTETMNMHKQVLHLMTYFKETVTVRY